MERKKANIIVSRTGLRYAHKKLNFAYKIFFFEKCFFAYKIRFAVEKKTKKTFWRKFSKLLEKFLCRHQKMPVIQFPYMKIVWKAIFFSKKNILNQFFLSPVCSTVLKKQQKWFNFFSLVFRKCMKIV